MNGFFSDNQTKQKAYDTYYNAMARSDFIQGRKLKALIQKENADDAMTDNLASLFQKAMSKSRDYEYDQIIKQLLKKAPAVLVDGAAPAKASKAKKSSPTIVNIAGKKTKSPKKYTFVPQTTDTDMEMKPAAPLTPSPTKTDYNMVTPEKKATPPRRRASSAKNFESEMNWKPSVAPNVLSPKSMAEHKARVAAEELKEAAYAPELAEEAKYFTDLFSTGEVTAEDERNAEAKISKHEDDEKINEFINKLSRERLGVLPTFSRSVAGKRARSSSVSVTADKSRTKIAKFLKKKDFSYLSRPEKVVVAAEMSSMVEEYARAEKRKRETTPDGKSPSEKRDTKTLIVPTSPSPQKKLDFDEVSEVDDEEAMREIEEEQKELAHNEKRLQEAAEIFDNAKTPAQLRSAIKLAFGKEINKMLAKREGATLKSNQLYNLFDKEIRKPVKKESLKTYQNYLSLSGMLSGIYMIRK